MKYCEKCGRKDSGENNFCSQCGGTLTEVREKKKFLFFIGIPSLIAITLVVVLFITGVFSTSETKSRRSRVSDMEEKEILVELENIENIDYILPEAEVSGTKELNLEPIAGVRLHADENALDKNREFKVEALEDDVVINLLEKMPTNDMFPLRGIEIDSEMLENELFPGELEVTFDLVELGIPEELYNYLEVVRIHDEIEITPMHAQLSGNELTFATDKNSLFILLCTLNAIGVFKIFEDVEKYGSDELRYTKLYDGYYIFWPASMPCGNIAEVEKQAKLITDLAEKYGFNKERMVSMYEKEGTKSTNEALNKLMKLFTDQSVVDALELVNSKEWQKENFWPSKVAITAENLDKAYQYLFTSTGINRGFKKPSHIDIIIFEKWKSGSEQLAITEAPFLGRAYMQINCEKATIDNNVQIMTLAHELFHVSQLRYYFHKNAYFGGLSFGYQYEDLWFDEMTALTLQFEAERDLKLGDNEVYQDRLVHIDLATKLMADSEGDQSFQQNQGYFYSFLLEFLRSKESDSNQYLHKLLGRYNHDSVETIFGKTNDKTGLLNEFFMSYAPEFYKIYLEGHIKAEALVVDEKMPVIKNNLNTIGLSTMFKEIYYSSEKEGKLVFRLQDNIFSRESEQSLLMLDANEAVVRVINPDNYDVFDYEVPDNCSRDAAKRMSCIIQEVQTASTTIDSKFFDIFVLYKPEAPEVKLRSEGLMFLDINVKESGLAGEIVEEYQWNILCPSGSEYEIATSEVELSLPINVSSGNFSEQVGEIKGVISFKELSKSKSEIEADKSDSYQVSYIEIANGDNKVKGPVSDITKTSMTATITIGAPRIVTYEMVEDAVVSHDFDAYSNYQKDCTIEWDFGDSSEIVTTDGNDSQVSHEYSELGEYYPKAVLYDETGKKLAEDSISIELVKFEEEEEEETEDEEQIGLTTYTVTIPFSDYDLVEEDGDKYWAPDQTVTLTVYKAEKDEDDYTRIQFNYEGESYIYSYVEQYDSYGRATGLELVGECTNKETATIDGINEGYNSIQDGFIAFDAHYVLTMTKEGYLYDSDVNETYTWDSYCEAFIMLDTMTFEITFGPGSFVIPLE